MKEFDGCALAFLAAGFDPWSSGQPKFAKQLEMPVRQQAPIHKLRVDYRRRLWPDSEPDLVSNQAPRFHINLLFTKDIPVRGLSSIVKRNIGRQPEIWQMTVLPSVMTRGVPN